MMTSSNGNIFRVTGPLCGKFTCHRWILITKASGAELWCFFICALNKQLSKQSWSWKFETPLRLLWCLCNDTQLFFGNKYSYVSNVEHKQMWILTQGMRNKINRLEGPNFRTWSRNTSLPTLFQDSSTWFYDIKWISRQPRYPIIGWNIENHGC